MESRILRRNALLSQGALCRIPTVMHLFSAKVNADILNAGVFVLALCAPVGSIFLDVGGVWLLRYMFVVQCKPVHMTL